jgi:hypothetical protein
MKRFALLTVIVTAVLTLGLPFVGGGGPAIDSTPSSAFADEASAPVFATPVTSSAADSATTAVDASLAGIHPNEAVVQSAQAHTNAYLTTDTEHLAQKPVPVPVIVVQDTPANPTGGTAARKAAHVASGTSCPSGGGGGGSGPGGSDGQGATGTTTSDIQAFSALYNSIRVANCLQPVPAGNFRYDSCMEQRLYWMAEDPSSDPNNTWGHLGVHSLAVNPATGAYYSDAVPSRGCDGNLAGGSGNTGSTVAQKWWDSLPHRTALYKPSYTGSTAGVCIYFAMTHGGVMTPGIEPQGFTRAAARWGTC